ncbi:cytochrome P450 [Ephemerocybe angulata]|uniref:Cytochrome P450 n=1 Tax=Ephemerocybe angulata TaxID=980116 RepID=A0A8H6HSP2_9AGAR|nr:cytochrome P450 [Tulosesus angulatus]
MASSSGIAFMLTICGLPALAGYCYLFKQEKQRSRREYAVAEDYQDKHGPICQTKLWGRLVAVVTKPLLLTRLENELKVLHTSGPRQEKICMLTGIADAVRLTEVMEERMISITFRELSPNGLLPSGLLTSFDKGLALAFATAPGHTDFTGAQNISLSEFVSYSVFYATAFSFFGPKFPVESHHDFSVLASNAHLLRSPISRWSLVSCKAHAARSAMMKTFSRFIEEWWYADGLDHIEGISPLMERVLQASKEEELTMEEAAGCLFVLFCDAVTNVTPMSFWAMAHVLKDHSIYRSLRHETRSQPASHLYGPLLESVVQETLRWAPSPQPTRQAVADADFALEGKRYRLKAGTQIVSDMSEYHFDMDLYPQPQIFQPKRFLSESLPLPRPFGEGKHMCKGMYLAVFQIKSFISNTLRSFDLRVMGCRATDTPTENRQQMGSIRALADMGDTSMDVAISVARRY